MLTKKEKKEYVFKKLDEVLKPQGYYLVKTGFASNSKFYWGVAYGIGGFHFWKEKAKCRSGEH